MVHTNEPGASAATAAPPTNRIRLSGEIVAAPERADAGDVDPGALISRERRRHVETQAAAEPLADAAGARVCCVLCLNRNAELTVEDAG